ncbi:hypothetical protein C7S14_0115 [Burkholderia cepacia]|nr:hypothetical protein C7S14_0115 [Burkholderia cepacia]
MPTNSTARRDAERAGPRQSHDATPSRTCARAGISVMRADEQHGAE